MKPIKRFCVSTALTGLLIFFPNYLRSEANYSFEEGANVLTVALFADKDIYELGEEIELTIRIMNTSNEPVLLHSHADVWHGNLQILVAYENEDFKEYRGPRWGLKDSGELTFVELLPNDCIDSEATVLFNHKIRTKHLCQSVASIISQGRINTDYALPVAGRYKFKAVLYDSEFKNSIGSKPIEIFVNKSTGEDKEVWKVLRTDPNYGYFIQTGSPKGHPKGPKAQEVVRNLEDLIMIYPSSKHVKKIKDSLSHYHSLWD